MRRYILVVISLVLILALTACANEQNSAAQPGTTLTEETAMDTIDNTISPADAKKLIGNEGVILVDVRTQEEYREGHIPQAVLLPLDDIELKAGDILPNKDAVIIVYCRSGRRSKIASEELKNMGYKTVYDLGGIIDWPYETVTA